MNKDIKIILIIIGTAILLFVGIVQSMPKKYEEKLVEKKALEKLKILLEEKEFRVLIPDQNGNVVEKTIGEINQFVLDHRQGGN